MITDWGQKTQPWFQQPVFPSPGITKKSEEQTLKEMQKFMELIEKAKEYDLETKQPECTDNRKDKFIQELEDLIKKYKK